METDRMIIIRDNPQSCLSASVAYGNLLFLSGQMPKSSEDDIVLQTYEVLEKIDALLAAAGSDERQILSVQIWLKDVKRDFVVFNNVWVQWMPEGQSPARAAVQAEIARPDILVEIMFTVIKAQGRIEKKKAVMRSFQLVQIICLSTTRLRHGFSVSDRV